MSQLRIVSLPEFDQTGGRTIITSKYGPRWGRNHNGTDLGTLDGIEIGTPVYAPLDGVVTNLKDDRPLGPEGAGLNLHFLALGGRRFKFFHLSRFAVALDQSVKQGQVIAYVGMTGTSAPHLHEEEHAGSFNNPIDNTADIRAAMNAGRWPGQTPQEGDEMNDADFARIQAMQDRLRDEILNELDPRRDPDRSIRDVAEDALNKGQTAVDKLDILLNR